MQKQKINTARLLYAVSSFFFGARGITAFCMDFSLTSSIARNYLYQQYKYFTPKMVGQKQTTNCFKNMVKMS